MRRIVMSEIPAADRKWFLPGWKIEAEYSNKVLIGNWAEERQEFKRGSDSSRASCYGKDFVSFPMDGSSAMLGRAITKKMQLMTICVLVLQGLPKKHLTTHHGVPDSKYLVSLYDDDYIRHGNSLLPPIRTYNKHRLIWVPERSSNPTAEPPTNYGLKKVKEMQWRESSSKDVRSVYSTSYKNLPPSAFAAARYGVAPRALSSNMNQNNNVNKSLQLRNQRPLQVPDYPAGRTKRSTVTKLPPLRQKPLTAAE
ncbi:cilia- and flagella-associated protein 107-like [Spea bombifrons]|uniref:cilia- and flagella-associated protein 107-like n=1 Tax=Spea bombifrons TaxID=233779 RepID=UPI00234BC183|nr:cilia- and flagella-associated protein 107-like [Spea bombifrons]